AERILPDVLAPLRIPRHPLALMRFGLRGIQSARGLAERWFKGERARGLFTGLAAHSILPLEQSLTASIGLMLGLIGHAVGWPLPRGGSQKITDAMVSYLHSLGGELQTGSRITALAQLPPARAYLFDVSPGALSRICGDHLPERFRRKLERFRHGPGAFKLDWALDGPIPWKSPE